MRKLIFPLLMASVLMPAAVQAEPGDRGMRVHGERSESNDEKSQDRPQRAERAAPSNSDAPRVHVERAQRNVEGNGGEQHVRRFGGQQGEPVQQVQQVEQVQQVQQVERVRRGGGSNDGAARSRIRWTGEQRTAQQQQQQQQDTVQVHRDRGGFEGLHDRIVRNGDRVDSKHRWSRDWRNDNHYNWYSYRNRYGSLYRLGRYNDPYGYGYRRFTIGYNLWPSYFGSSYWLNDPWQYRLPPAYGPYRWVRYYDDALLVNIYDGQVVDVIYNFFW